MKTKKTSNVLGVLLMSLSFLFITSCNNDDDVPNDPVDTITLNMLDEQNGKTLLGKSDMYINKANNFYTSSSLISDAGNANGLGEHIAPNLGNLAHEVAVTPGHVYQVFDKETIHDFPSGVRALQVSAVYYKVYAVSPITLGTKSTGAIVRYVSVYPDSGELPEVGHTIGEVSSYGESVSMAFPAGAECFWYGGDPIFEVSTKDGVLRMTLNKQPTEYNGVYGSYAIYIRLGDVYTIVYARVIR